VSSGFRKNMALIFVVISQHHEMEQRQTTGFIGKGANLARPMPKGIEKLYAANLPFAQMPSGIGIKLIELILVGLSLVKFQTKQNKNPFVMPFHYRLLFLMAT
jgi:hypothetical protein